MRWVGPNVWVELILNGPKSAQKKLGRGRPKTRMGRSRPKVLGQQRPRRDVGRMSLQMYFSFFWTGPDLGPNHFCLAQL